MYFEMTLQFLYISLGSLAELETQILIAEKLKFIESLELLKMVENTRRPLLGLIKYLRKGN
jgi:four helix bundle protein